MNRKIELIKFLQPFFSDRSDDSIALEAAYSRRILEKFEWRQLSDDEKQNRRKGAISLSRKWDESPFIFADDLMKIDHSYSENVIIVYDLVRDLLKTIESVSKDTQYPDIFLLRFENALRIEKEYLDEDFRPRLHLPKLIFESLAINLNPSYPQFNLNFFVTKYSKMYDIWPDKPKN